MQVLSLPLDKKSSKKEVSLWLHLIKDRLTCKLNGIFRSFYYTLITPWELMSKSPVTSKKTSSTTRKNTKRTTATQKKTTPSNSSETEQETVDGKEPIEPELELDDNLDDLSEEDEDDDLALDDDDEDITGGALAVYSPSVPVERPQNSLQAYIQEVSQFPLLEPEEELELARRVRDTGDPNAAFRLISSHLRLVVKIAMGFQRRWMQNVLDLIQEGNVGLVRAVDKFDPEKGIKFSYYARFWIKAYILKFIMDNWRLVKLGTTQTQRKLFYNLNKERQMLLAQGYDPDSATLAKRLNVSEDQIIEMEQRLDTPDVSLDAPVNAEEGNQTRLDYMPALGAGVEELLANEQMATLIRDRLDELMPHLSDKEQYILEHRLLTDDPLTLREIGDVFSITRERVRQIEARLLQKVRDHLVSNIKDFSEDWIG